MHESTELADLSAAELLRLFREGRASPLEAAEAVLDRIRRGDERLNAFCFLDEETTRSQARRSEERYRRGEPHGRLDGVPVPIKDVFLTRGWPTRKGSRTIDPAGPWEADASVVAALRRNGAVFVGKTTTPELGWKGVTDSPLTGVTRNPWNPDLTCGGSSGGSAAALVAGMGAVAPGSDAGGSIRMPAGFCGLVGMKPTHGRAPMWPASVFYPLAHVGPLARTVEDTALLMNVLCESDPRDATALPPNETDFVAALGGEVSDLRMAFSPNLGFVDVDPEIAEAVYKAVRAFEELGAVVEEADPGFADPVEAFETLFYAGAANALRDRDGAQRQQMDPALVEAAERAEGLSAVDYLAANGQRLALGERMGLFHRSYDLLLTPTLPIPAFAAGRDVPEGWPHSRWPSWTPFTYPFNLTGQPAISVPCGLTGAGLPIGLQIVGPRYADASVLRAARAYELKDKRT